MKRRKKERKERRKMNPKKTKDNFESVVREEKENKMNYKKEEGVAKRTGVGY